MSDTGYIGLTKPVSDPQAKQTTEYTDHMERNKNIGNSTIQAIPSALPMQRNQHHTTEYTEYAEGWAGTIFGVRR